VGAAVNLPPQAALMDAGAVASVKLFPAVAAANFF
jgi:hypothetical protein